MASVYETDVFVENYLEVALAAAKVAAAQAPNRENRLDALVNSEGLMMETHPRNPANWLEASATAGFGAIRIVISPPIGRAGRIPGSTAIGPRSTPTGNGTSWAAAMIP